MTTDDGDYDEQSNAAMAVSEREREMYARASIVSDMLRNNSSAGIALDAQMLVEQADTLWKWVKSGLR